MSKYLDSVTYSTAYMLCAMISASGTGFVNSTVGGGRRPAIVRGEWAYLRLLIEHRTSTKSAYSHPRLPYIDCVLGKIKPLRQRCSDLVTQSVPSSEEAGNHISISKGK